MSSQIRGFTLASVLVTAVACGSGEPSVGFASADSAGVTIATSTAPAWQTGEEWTVNERPVVDIGVVEGAPEFQLHRVSNAVRLNNGNIVVANSGTQELRCYGGDGLFLWTAGGEGGGPGEFEGLFRVESFYDSVIAFDRRSSRVSVFNSDGTFVRTSTLRDPRGVLQGVFADGSLLITDSDIRTHLQRRVLGEREEIDDGNVRLTDVALRHSSEGVFIDSIGVFPGAEGMIFTRTSGEVFAVSFSYQPLGRATVFAVRGNKLLSGGQGEYQITVRSLDGTIEALVRRAIEARMVSEADIATLRAEYLDGLAEPDEIQARMDEFEGHTIPERMPAFGEILVDSEGFIWVEEYRIGDEAPEWAVFDNDYRMLGSVATPPGLTVQQIGQDYVLGTWTDELDVEHVRLFNLVRQ
jgi:hypothetical protein